VGASNLHVPTFEEVSRVQGRCRQRQTEGDAIFADAAFNAPMFNPWIVGQSRNSSPITPPQFSRNTRGCPRVPN
jgi:hypothetical protein